MKEPNLEGMIDFLVHIGSENAEELTVDHIYESVGSSGKDMSREIEQLLYYCKDEQAATVENRIKSLGDDDKKCFLKALVAFYPMTKNIIMQMLRRAGIKPAEFLEVYDVNHDMLEVIKKNIDEIKKNSTSNSVSVNSYNNGINNLKDEIDSLKGAIQELQGSITDYQDKVAEKEELEDEIKKLKDLKNSGIDTRIANLKQEKERLEGEKSEKVGIEKNLKDEIQQLENEIKDSNETQDDKCQDVLNQLQECIKKLVK